MASGAPWHVAGVHPQARETAEEAARRAGISVGDWLDLAILQSARTDAALSSGRDGESRQQEAAQQERSFDDQPQGMFSDDTPPPDPPSDAPFVDIKNRLDELARELDDFDQRGATNAGPEQANSRRDDRTPRQIASALSRRSSKRDPLNTNRRSANPEESLDDRTDHEPPQQAAMDALSPLAQALAEIAERQRALDGEAALPHVGLPRAPTQNLGGLEQHLRGINTRLGMLQPGFDDDAISSLRDGLSDVSLMLKEAAPRELIETQVHPLAQRPSHSGQHGPDLTNLERGLAEIRDALRTLTPAERLVGLDERVHALSQKLDGLAATKEDTTALTKIELAIAGLRDILSNVASNEAFAKLAGEVRSVAGNDHAAVKHIENRIIALVEKFDTSDARLDHLEAIERKLADLLILLDSQRAAPPGRGELARVPDVNSLNYEVKRTQDSIEALHGTLGLVVKRLATIESGVRGTQDTVLSGVQNLPPDYPLEPGFGVLRENGTTTPADRIAASEAALGPVRPTGHQQSGREVGLHRRRAPRRPGRQQSPSHTRQKTAVRHPQRRRSRGTADKPGRPPRSGHDRRRLHRTIASRLAADAGQGIQRP